jgi:NADPH:quinone reductase-like Zn-dependent oxidoreductase
MFELMSGAKENPMKAIVYNNYGSPDVLHLEEVQTPNPQDDEVLVRVRATSVNAWDWHNMRAKPLFARPAIGMFHPRKKILGADVAGHVEAVGRNVTQFRLGDEVFGDLADFGGGGFAEYVSTSEDALVPKPTNMTFEEAATVPLAAITALQGLRDTGHIKAGQNVLINGASGGVGTFAVQIAKSFGAEVTGVCSAKNLDMVSSIGADHVIDYTEEDFTRNGLRYDLIFDAVGNISVADAKRALNSEGICVVIGFSSVPNLLKTVFIGPFQLLGSGKKMGLKVAKMNQEDLVFIGDLLETKKVVPVIDRRYSLNDVAEAVRYIEDVHAQGKVVITV